MTEGGADQRWKQSGQSGSSEPTPERSAPTPDAVSRRRALQLGGLAVGSAAFGGLIGFQARSGGSRGGVAKPSWKVGAIVPKKGDLLGEGQETVRGLELGLKIINGRGGVGGRPVELAAIEVPDLAEETLTAAAGQITNQEVLATFLGFTSPSSSELSIYSEYGAPLFLLSPRLSFEDGVPGGENAFSCFPAARYDSVFPRLLSALNASGLIPPTGRSLAIVTTDDPREVAQGVSLASAAKAAGLSAVVLDGVVSGQADWAPVMRQLVGTAPSMVALAMATPADLAGFQKAFVEAAIPAIVYALFGPSVPEYLGLAGEAANGVIWSTPVGTITGDAASARLEELFQKKNGKSELGLSQLGANFDAVRFWAQCAGLAKKPAKFSAVAKVIPEVLFRGVSGTLNLGDPSRVAAGFPAETRDPSLGLPHLMFQIQEGKHVRVAPSPFIQGEIKAPSWR